MSMGIFNAHDLDVTFEEQRDNPDFILVKVQLTGSFIESFQYRGFVHKEIGFMTPEFTALHLAKEIRRRLIEGQKEHLFEQVMEKKIAEAMQRHEQEKGQKA